MAPTPEELTHFISEVIAKTEIQNLIASGDYKSAFSQAGLPAPTETQIVALIALVQDWPTLRALGRSFNSEPVAN